MKPISKKMKYVKTDGWRGYEEPQNAVCGANDTGTYSDSPCNSNDCENELKQARKILRQNSIRFVSHWGRSSNVFCIHRYLLTDAENKEKALELLEPLVSETRLLYLCK